MFRPNELSHKVSRVDVVIDTLNGKNRKMKIWELKFCEEILSEVCDSKQKG